MIYNINKKRSSGLSLVERRLDLLNEVLILYNSENAVQNDLQSRSDDLQNTEK